jgi:hypothetical protein
MVKHAHIADAICAVMTEVGQIERDRKIDGGGARYAYLSDDAVVAKVQASMARNGLSLVPETMAIIDHPTVKTKNGETPGIRILVEWRLHHETGTVPLATIGEGNDSGDKGANKAMTAARKYAMRLAFSIASGDDPDDERPETGARGVQREQSRDPVREEVRRSAAAATAPSPATGIARKAFAILRDAGMGGEAAKLRSVIEAKGGECPDVLAGKLDSAMELTGPERLQALCEEVRGWPS